MNVLAKLLAGSDGGTGRGVVSVCAAGGQGVVAILERPDCSPVECSGARADPDRR